MYYSWLLPKEKDEWTLFLQSAFSTECTAHFVPECSKNKGLYNAGVVSKLILKKGAKHPNITLIMKIVSNFLFANGSINGGAACWSRAPEHSSCVQSVVVCQKAKTLPLR